MTELAGVLVGNYFLLERLGREGMVETYRARPTTKGGYDVILRLFRPEFPDPTSFREHFATEVEKVWRCSHEYMQPLLEFGTGDDLLYCATLAAESETLEHYLRKQPERFLPVPLVLRYVTQLCATLQYTHEQGIVHGNIQPSSILISDDKALLTHFSMKRAYQDSEPLVAQIAEGNAAYVAPEQALGMMQPTNDIYALGVLLYRLLSGVLPYDDENSGEIALKHANEPIPSLRALRPELPEALELVIRVALSKSPEARFPNAAALAQALHKALVPDSPLVVSATPERHIMTKTRRTRFTWSRAASFLTMSVLLFGLVGTSLFIFSLPQHIYDLPIQPFWPLGQSGGAVLSPGSGSATQHATSTVLSGIPSKNGATPVGGTKVGVTPTAGKAQTPIAGSTVVATPTHVPTPTSSSFLCVSGTLSIAGSPNLAPLLQQMNNDYQKQCPGLTIALAEEGSRAALNGLQQNQIDVASSDLTASPSRNLTDQPIAALLYGLVVSPDVQVSDLSSTEIQDMYQGRITNWAQVGGPDEPITIIQHSSDTVTAIFRAFVLNGASIHAKGQKLKNNWAQAVAQTPGAISYVSLLEAQGANVSVLAIDGVQPTTDALLQGSYPFWSIEHLYTQGSGSPQFQAYLPFLTSTQETHVFAQYSAIPVRMLSQDVLASHLPGPEI